MQQAPEYRGLLMELWQDWEAVLTHCGKYVHWQLAEAKPRAKHDLGMSLKFSAHAPLYIYMIGGS